MPKLTDDQIAQYRRDGYLCPIDIFSAEEAATSRAALEGLENDFDGKLDRPVSHYMRSSPFLVTDLPLSIARNPGILDAVEGILGPDILMWSCEFFIKEANTTKIVSWHQDLTYWGMDGSDHEVTAWLALSPATAASGCMKFVPGSHQQALVPHEDTFAEDNLLSRGQEVAVDVDEADAVAAELRPGQMSLHHGRLFHASGANTTDDRRIGLAIRYIRPDTPAESDPDYAVLMRGADRARQRINLSPPPGDFTPQRLALYGEVWAAHAEITAAGLEDTNKMHQGDATLVIGDQENEELADV